MFRTQRARKGPGGCGGWGLDSRNRRGPGVPPTPGLRGQGTSPGSPAGFLCSSGQAKRSPLLSCSSSLGSGRAPPACLSWSPHPPSCVPKDPHTLEGPWRAGDRHGSSAGSPNLSGRANCPHSSPAPPRGHLPPSFPFLPSASFLCPQGPGQPGGGFEDRGSAWELSRLPGPQLAGQSPSAPHPLLPGRPSHLPLLISPASFLCPQDPRCLYGALGVGELACLSWSPWPLGGWSCLASTSSLPLVPLHPTGSLWGSSHLLGGQSPPPASGRHPSCGETLTLCLPTMPSWLLPPFLYIFKLLS